MTTNQPTDQINTILYLTNIGFSTPAFKCMLPPLNCDTLLAHSLARSLARLLSLSLALSLSRSLSLSFFSLSLSLSSLSLSLSRSYVQTTNTRSTIAQQLFTGNRSKSNVEAFLHGLSNYSRRAGRPYIALRSFTELVRGKY